MFKQFYGLRCFGRSLVASQPKATVTKSADSPALKVVNKKKDHGSLSLLEKQVDILINNKTGVVTHKHLFTEDGKERTFSSKEVFDKWLQSQRGKMLAEYRSRLTPFQFWVTQHKGTERAFTGEYWENKVVGKYSCIVCSQNLFMFDHKYNNTSGYPTFWNSLKAAVKFRDDHLDIPEPT